jgi:hypothetical protein
MTVTAEYVRGLAKRLDATATAWRGWEAGTEMAEAATTLAALLSRLEAMAEALRDVETRLKAASQP